MEDLYLIPTDRKIYAVMQPWHLNVLIVNKKRSLGSLFNELVMRYGGFSRKGGVNKSIREMAKECGAGGSVDKFHKKLTTLRDLGLISYGNRKSSMQGGTVLFINTDSPHQYASELPVIVRADKPVESTVEEVPTVEEVEVMTPAEEVIQDATEIVDNELAVVTKSHEEKLTEFYTLASRKACEEVFPPQEAADQMIKAMPIVQEHLRKGGNLYTAVTALYSVKYSDYGISDKSFEIGLKDIETIPYDRQEAWQENNFTLLALRNLPAKEKAEKERAARQAILDAERDKPRPTFVVEKREVKLDDLFGDL
jgi:hypothetical protein